MKTPLLLLISPVILFVYSCKKRTTVLPATSQTTVIDSPVTISSVVQVPLFPRYDTFKGYYMDSIYRGAVTFHTGISFYVVYLSEKLAVFTSSSEIPIGSVHDSYPITAAVHDTISNYGTYEYLGDTITCVIWDSLYVTWQYYTTRCSDIDLHHCRFAGSPFHAVETIHKR
jgi:hypothetical protein